MRSIRLIPHLLLLFSIALASGNVWAAVRCKMDETPDKCWSRATEEKLQNGAKAELLKQPTGVQAGETNLKSNTTDFLPLIAMSGLLGDAQEGGQEGTYTFDLNFLIPGLSKDKNSKFKALVNSQPTISESLKEQIPEADREEIAKKLQEDLGDLSDYSLSFTYSWVNSTHGRGFENYADRFAVLTQTAFRISPAAEVDREQRLAKDEFTTFIVDKQPGLIVEEGTTFGDIGRQLNSEDFAILMEKFERAADRSASALIARRKTFEDAGMDRFASLVDNQPQLLFSAEKHYRDPLAGNDELSVKVSYEVGRVNLNRALGKECRSALSPKENKTVPDTAARDCLSDYTAYVHDNKEMVDDGEKISFSVEYTDIDEEVFDLPQHNLTGLKLKGANRLVISGGLGRKFLVGGDGEPIRLDFVGRYEDISDDPKRRDRGVATLTVTRKIMGVEVPFGIVYANHGEFLGEVDKQFSAHLGLKFNLGGMQEAQGN